MQQRAFADGMDFESNILVIPVHVEYILVGVYCMRASISQMQYLSVAILQVHYIDLIGMPLISNALIV